jgi:outer membrane protein assembly factor BamB
MKYFLNWILLSFQIGLAQGSYIAVITNPEIGPQNNVMNLIETVDDINRRPNISYVAVLGNITESGKFDEFIWAQEILDGLTVPYFVVGGEKDYLFSEGNGSEITLLWGDDKNYFSENNFTIVGFNTFLFDYPKKKYISAETMSWLDNIFANNNTTRLLTFSYYPIQLAENNFQFFEKTLDKKLFSFITREDKSTISQSIFEGLYLNRKDGWGYLLVSVKNDSVLFKKILSEEIKNKLIPEIVKTSFKKSLLPESTEQSVFIQTESKLWSARIKKTKRTAPVYSEGKIFSVFDKGLVICINDFGKELWRVETNKRISNPPLLDDELLVVASDDGDILIFDASNGNQRQTIGIGEKISSDISIVDINDHGKLAKAVTAGTTYGNLYCYDLFYLDPIWTEPLNTYDSNIRVASSIVSSSNKIFFYDNEGTLYCLTSKNGMLIWKIQSSSSGWKIDFKIHGLQKKHDIIVIQNDLYLIDGSGNLFCVDALLGTLKWNLKNIEANGLIRFDGKASLILPTTNNKIVFVSAKTGKIISEIELPIDTKAESITDLLLIGDQILIGFSDGWVYRIRSKKKIEKFFRGSLWPIASLTNVDNNCLVTDYDGNFTLLKISPGKK